jgi:hypothetical protein
MDAGCSPTVIWIVAWLWNEDNRTGPLRSYFSRKSGEKVLGRAGIVIQYIGRACALRVS